MTPKTIITIGENDLMFRQLNRWLSSYRMIPVLEKCWHNIEQYKPGMVICMAQGQLPDALLRLKQQDWFPRIPTLLIHPEQSTDLTSLAKAYSLGFADCCPWPTEQEVLCGKVETHFRKPGWTAILNQKFFSFRQQQSQRTARVGLMANDLSSDSSRRPTTNFIPEKGLYVRFLGHFSLYLDGEKLPDKLSKKDKSILAYLLYHSGNFLHREKIMETFWPEVPASSSRNSLNVAISHIRAYLRPFFGNINCIKHQNEGYVIHPSFPLASDVNQFKANCKSGWEAMRNGSKQAAVDFLDQASRIYQDDFLLEFRYEDWCECERDALKETFLSVLNSLAVHYHEEEEFSKVIPIAERILNTAPFLEDVHRLLIDCFAQLDMRGRALKQYQKCKSLLKTHFQVEPSLQTQHLIARIRGT